MIENEALSSPNIQILLRALLDGRIKEIRPLIIDEVTYPDVQKLNGLDARGVEGVLQLLVSENILLRKPLDCVFTCPYCRSIRMLYKLRCPTCGSTCMKTGKALEHMHCGYVDMEEGFSGPSGFQCPKCRRTLKAIGVDYRSVGIYYRCISCREVNSSIDQIFYCMQCSRTCRINEASLTVYDSYYLNEEAKEKIMRCTIDLSLIAETLRVHGFETELDCKVLGNSGIYHIFTVAVRNKRKRDGDAKPDIIADITISSNEVGESSILCFMAKTTDIGCQNNIQAVVPRSSEPARKLARFYGINLVECEEVAELPKKIAELMVQIVTGVSEKQFKAGHEPV